LNYDKLIIDRWSILDKLQKLYNLNFSFQISLEWLEKVNDNIRWKWSFQTIKDKIVLLKRRWFKVHLSFTLTNQNKEEVFKLVPFIREYNIRLNVRRLVPMWQSKEEYDLMLSAEEWYKFTIKVANVNMNILNKNKFCKIWLSWCSELTWYKYDWAWCGVNDHRILIIMHNLDILSCRRLPIVLWNLKDAKLKDIFFWKEYMEQINSSKKIDICQKCSYYNWCKWWAKCITYAKEKTLSKEDPQCFFAKLLLKKK